jgi:hypothetical protein
VVTVRDSGEIQIYSHKSRSKPIEPGFTAGDFKNKDLTLMKKDDFGNLELKDISGIIFRLNATARVLKSIPQIRRKEPVYFLYNEENKCLDLAYFRLNTLDGKTERSGGLIPMSAIQNPKISAFLNKLDQ